MARDIANTTCVDAVLASEEHQHITTDCRAADGAGARSRVAVEAFPEASACLTTSRGNKCAQRSMIVRWLRHAGFGWGRQYPVQTGLLLSPFAATKLAR
jgi:hypothetical protein